MYALVCAGHTGKISGLAIDPWGRFVLTSSTDGTAKVWDLSSSRAIHTFVSGSTPEQGKFVCMLVTNSAKQLVLLVFLCICCFNHVANLQNRVLLGNSF